MLIGVPASARVAPRANAAGDQLLRLSLDAPKSVSYIGQVETIRFASNRAAATIVKIEHRAPDATRRWYVAPEELYRDYVIARGTTVYSFDTKQNRVTVTHDQPADTTVATVDGFARLRKNYRAVLDGNAVVADRPTISVVIINRYTGERAMRVWLDRETHLLLKKEEYHANGSVASQVRFDAIRYTASIPNGIFATDTPAGFTQVPGRSLEMLDADVDRVIAQAGFKPYEPQNLPQGFELTGADVTEVGGVKTLHLFYSDGLRSLSLFENARGAAADYGSLRPTAVRLDGHDGQYVEDGPTTLLTWKESNLHFALVGDLLRGELIDIAKSVVP